MFGSTSKTEQSLARHSKTIYDVHDTKLSTGYSYAELDIASSKVKVYRYE